MASRKRSKASRRPKEAKRSAAHRNPADEQAATELVMYIENTSDLSPDGPSGQGRSVLLNALRKWKKGTYDPKLAVRLFEYLVESGAKRYAKEFGSSEKEWSTMFNPATRHEAAKQLEASFRSSVENGEYEHVDTRIGTREERRPVNDRLFIGTYPTGIVYADKSREKHGDYARCAFLDFATLTLKFEPDCPAKLRAEIERDAAKIQARRGEPFEISGSGHTVILGGRGAVRAARHQITGPGADGVYHYRGASIELSSAGTRHWWATVRFRHQEIDFEAQSSDEALEKAKNWIDASPELNYSSGQPREARRLATAQKVRDDDEDENSDEAWIDAHDNDAPFLAQNWYSGQGDPLYALISTGFPQPESTVEWALSNAQKSQTEHETDMVEKYGRKGWSRLMNIDPESSAARGLTPEKREDLEAGDEISRLVMALEEALSSGERISASEGLERQGVSPGTGW